MLKTALATIAFGGFLATVAFAAPLAPKVPAAPAAPAVAAPAAPAAPAAMPDKMDSAKKMKSKSCSMQADKQGLHGKMRKKFREDCKKAA